MRLGHWLDFIRYGRYSTSAASAPRKARAIEHDPALRKSRSSVFLSWLWSSASGLSDQASPTEAPTWQDFTEGLKGDQATGAQARKTRPGLRVLKAELKGSMGELLRARGCREGVP